MPSPLFRKSTKHDTNFMRSGRDNAEAAMQCDTRKTTLTIMLQENKYNKSPRSASRLMSSSEKDDSS